MASNRPAESGGAGRDVTDGFGSPNSMNPIYVQSKWAEAGSLRPFYGHGMIQAFG